MRILLTGGAGYIGSVVVEECLRSGHDAFVFDNSVKGHRESVAPEAEFIEGDLLDGELLKSTFKSNRSRRPYGGILAGRRIG